MITILRASPVPQPLIMALYTVKKITIKNTTMEEKNTMKKSNRTLALITAAVSALSAAAAAVPVQSLADDSASANSYKIDKNIIRSTYFNRNSDSYDFGGRNSFKKDGKKDYYDYLIMEDEIVDMYAKVEYPNRKLSCSEVKLSEGAENAGLTPSDLDINHDGFLSPEDYAIYLNALTKDYELSHTDGEAAFNIVKYNGSNADEIVVPASFYDAEHGTIKPALKIESRAFSSCTALSKVYLNDYRQPNWIDRYGKPMNIDHKVMANTYLFVDNDAFSGCSQLTSIYFPQNLALDLNSFNGTPFNSSENRFDNAGVTYFKDSDTDSPKVFAFYPDPTKAVIDGSLAFIPGTTGINAWFDYYEGKEYRNSIRNLIIPKTVNYIGHDAFVGLENLETVNDKEFAELTPIVQDKIRKYVNAFNCTKFMAKENQAQLDKIIARIADEYNITENSSDRDKQLAAAKEVVRNITYTAYCGNWDFSIYPDTPYSTLDYSRSNIYSELAGLTTGHTTCGGIAAVYSLLLDMLGVKNYRVGGAEHSFNVVYIDGQWSMSDLTSYCNEYNNDLEADHRTDFTASKLGTLSRMTFDSINSDNGRYASNIYSEPSFKFYEASKNKQFITEGEENNYYFVMDPTDRSKLFVYKYFGTDGRTSAKATINARLAKLGDNTVTSLQLYQGLNIVGNRVYFIDDYEKKDDEKIITMLPRNGYLSYEDACKHGNFDEWSRSYDIK